MTRILFCMPRFHTNMVPWVRVLQEAGHQIDIHVQRVGGSEDHRLVTPLVVEAGLWSRRAAKLSKKRADPDFYHAPDIREYWKRLREENPDVVVVRGITRWFCRMAALIARMQGRRVVIYDQEEPVPEARGSTWYRRSLSKLLGFKVVTARVAEPGTELGGFGYAKTLPFGALQSSQELERSARKRLSQEHAVPSLLMVGKYRARKGHAELVRALGRLSRDHEFRITFCGEELNEADRNARLAVQELCEQVGIADKVGFRSNLRLEQVLALYSENQIFILPSRNEPAAVSPIEAAWQGCAVLVDHKSGTRFYLPAEHDFSFDASSSDDIARAVAPLLSDRRRLANARRACLSRIAEISGDEAVLAAFNSAVLADRP